MLSPQFGQDLVLALDLLFQVKDAFLFGLLTGAAFGLKGGGSVLEEFFLPAVEHRWLQLMAPQDGDLLFCGVVLPCLFHAYSPLSQRLNAPSTSS